MRSGDHLGDAKCRKRAPRSAEFNFFIRAQWLISLFLVRVQRANQCTRAKKKKSPKKTWIPILTHAVQNFHSHKTKDNTGGKRYPHLFLVAGVRLQADGTRRGNRPRSRRRRTGSGDACEISSTICWKVNSGFTSTICHGKRHFLFLSITLNENKSPSDNSRSESHSVIFLKLLQSSRLPLPNQLYFSASTSYVWATHRGRPCLSVKLVGGWVSIGLSRACNFRTVDRVSRIMPALNLALNADFEKKALKKHYWALFEHYLHFSELKRLKNKWKPGISWTNAIACCEKPFSAQVLCVVAVW